MCGHKFYRKALLSPDKSALVFFEEPEARETIRKTLDVLKQLAMILNIKAPNGVEDRRYLYPVDGFADIADHYFPF